MPEMSAPRSVPAIVAAASAGALLAALAVQFGLDAAPCRLCIWQRYPHLAAAAVAAPLTASVGERVRRAGLAVCAAVLLVGTAIAGFHVGVEQGWWSGLPGCSAPGVSDADSVEEMRSLLKQRTAAPSCETPALTLLGISMAGYNLLLSAALAALATAGALRMRLPLPRGRPHSSGGKRENHTE